MGKKGKKVDRKAIQEEHREMVEGVDRELKPTVRDGYLPGEWADQLQSAMLNPRQQMSFTVNRPMTIQGQQIIQQILVPAVNLFIEKNNGYGEPEVGLSLGIKGYFTDLWRKVPKLKRIIWDGQAAERFETREEILQDLLGSVLLCLWSIKYEEGGQPPVDLTGEGDAKKLRISKDAQKFIDEIGKATYPTYDPSKISGPYNYEGQKDPK